MTFILAYFINKTVEQSDNALIFRVCMGNENAP